MNRNAFALSIVLWIVAAILLGIAFIVTLSKDTLILSKNLHNKLDARLEAVSVLEALKFVILTSNHDSFGLIINTNLPYKFPKKIVLDGRKYKITKDITISLRDTSSILNVMNVNLITALAVNNNQRELAFTIRDSLKDWKDSDNIVSLNGAEKAYYKHEKGVFYGPRNSMAFQSLDELRIIKGLDSLSSKEWEKLKEHLYYGNGSYINLALINQLYLSKLLKLTSFEAKELEKYKTQDYKRFLQIINQNKNYNDEYMGYGLSFKIKIDIIVRNHNSVSRLHTFINFKRMLSYSFGVKNFKIY